MAIDRSGETAGQDWNGGRRLTTASADSGSDSVPTDHQRVRVWFGRHVIADYRARCDRAQRYAAAMRRRFAGLEITIDPIVSGPDRPSDPLPDERWWEIVPK